MHLYFLLKNVNAEFGGYNSLPHMLLVVEYISMFSFYGGQLGTLIKII